MFRAMLLCAPLVALTGAASAADAPGAGAMRSFVESNVLGWAQETRVVSAIQSQNQRTASASAEDIAKWDTEWRSQVGTAASPLIDQVLQTPLSAFLSEQVAASGGRINEIFVMDAQGLNVASSAVTSDYWQGDESKFSQSFGQGAGTIFVDEVEFDESTQTYQGQVSVALSDPATGAVIGAMTIGLNAESFY
ncbi:hypothetical protein FDT80_03460 [Sulfitobacter sabulilitoris]|uniref:Penicillin-binding protein activator LpoB n=2 Tax=Sulfitobacter sabulilitoris TaxID=2562655 RepID=A0A5S3PMM4_9RHOB|nr:hypothetical protein FDT80_03460 [Sulfitobacter sabulilitoris]